MKSNILTRVKKAFTAPRPSAYIAGKITDLPEATSRANFERAKREVIALGYSPVSPLDLPHRHGHTWEEFMKEDMRELLRCDVVYAQHNWWYSRGAIIEVTTARDLGIQVIYQTPDDITNIALDHLLSDQCECGNRHPLVREFGRCGKCMEMLHGAI